MFEITFIDEENFKVYLNHFQLHLPVADVTEDFEVILLFLINFYYF